MSRPCSNDSITHNTTSTNSVVNNARTHSPTPDASPIASVDSMTPGVLRILDLRPVAHEAGGADDAERAREAGPDDEHHDRADDRQDDLGLNHGHLPWRRAPSPRPERQHARQRSRQRQAAGRFA